ncbi:MAG: diaminopimelate epimerase [Verrucomicrobiota bacterium]|nr:diaminopimelate epimerase [Verrucomicrobiota bacterium]MEE2615832.1 diaminopimelate epimerase [Verrucomicrobiota bacterium]
MLVDFTKMNGAGNDFILIDNRKIRLQLSQEQIQNICDRQRGVGADGIMLLREAEGEADLGWDFFNKDGSEGEMCGNGARCFARFAQSKLDGQDSISFETLAGIIQTRLEGKNATISLTPPKDLCISDHINTLSGELEIHSVNTGVPHAVLFVEDADKSMVSNLGKEIRHHDHYSPAGTNVNFVHLAGENSIHVRTYERGVGETLACGTGVTASSLITAKLHGYKSPISVRVLGGDNLSVDFEVDGDSFKNVKLTGPAEFVFNGQIEI